MLPNLLLQIGPLPVYTFGVILAAAFLLGVFLFWRVAMREGFASDPIFDLIFLSVLAALIGGRLSFIVFTGDPSLSEGLSAFGGAILQVGEGIFWAPAFLFGLTAFYLYIRRRKEWSFFKLTDLVVPILALGQGIGFLGAEIAGYLSSVAYIGVGFLGLFLILEFAKRRATTSGVISFVYLLFSGFLTVLSEYLRVTKAEAFGIDLNYFLGAILSLVGVLGLLYHARRRFASALGGLRVGLFAHLLGRVERQLRFKLKRRQSDETLTERISEED